eukprot:GHVU01103050.1.p1 GENE.GHVU01103050.1~~GHVU01103050.1.p1  ORF type:complete len:148 (+),score=0.36 GHVU01103050.1:826-1269(+)
MSKNLFLGERLLCLAQIIVQFSLLQVVQHDRARRRNGDVSHSNQGVSRFKPILNRRFTTLRCDPPKSQKILFSLSLRFRIDSTGIGLESTDESMSRESSRIDAVPCGVRGGGEVMQGGLGRTVEWHPGPGNRIGVNRQCINESMSRR